MMTEPQNDPKVQPPADRKPEDQHPVDKAAAPQRMPPLDSQPDSSRPARESDLDEMLEQTFPASDPLPPGGHDLG